MKKKIPQQNTTKFIYEIYFFILILKKIFFSMTNKRNSKWTFKKVKLVKKKTLKYSELNRKKRVGYSLKNKETQKMHDHPSKCHLKLCLCLLIKT